MRFRQQRSSKGRPQIILLVLTCLSILIVHSQYVRSPRNKERKEKEGGSTEAKTKNALKVTNGIEKQLNKSRSHGTEMNPIEATRLQWQSRCMLQENQKLDSIPLIIHQSWRDFDKKPDPSAIWTLGEELA
eukprot:EG_transcript_40403